MKTKPPFTFSVAAVALAVLLFSPRLRAATYEVGPNLPLTAIGQVPWEKLSAGDTVLIHARPEPYREKFVICAAGRADAPITVRGVPDSTGNLPVLNGDGATTRAALKFWGDARSVIKIGGAEKPADTLPQYILIENLDIRGARPPHQFINAAGQPQFYRRNAAAIFVEKGEHITIRRCQLHNCGNGLFVSSNNQRAARDILVEENHIYDNGNERSGQEHNLYTEADGIVFQYNRLGPLRAGCLGNNLKDRSAGLVIRYNWIEGGNKELDLVDAEDSAIIRAEPSYHEPLVYGNIFLKLPGDMHDQLVHYGGDSDAVNQYRKGVLRFYNNTIISYRPATTVLFWLSSNDEKVNFQNNLVYLPGAKARLALAVNAGQLDLGHNWLNPGWQPFSTTGHSGTAEDHATTITGARPGFADFAAQDFSLTPGSPCRAAGAPFKIDRQYVKHQSGEPRLVSEHPDLGALGERGK